MMDRVQEHVSQARPSPCHQKVPLSIFDQPSKLGCHMLFYLSVPLSIAACIVVFCLGLPDSLLWTSVEMGCKACPSRGNQAVVWTETKHTREQLGFPWTKKPTSAGRGKNAMCAFIVVSSGLSSPRSRLVPRPEDESRETKSAWNTCPPQ